MSLLEKAHCIQTFNEYLANQVWSSNNNKRILLFVQKIGHYNRILREQPAKTNVYQALHPKVPQLALMVSSVKCNLD